RPGRNRRSGSGGTRTPKTGGSAPGRCQTAIALTVTRSTHHPAPGPASPPVLHTTRRLHATRPTASRGGFSGEADRRRQKTHHAHAAAAPFPGPPGRAVPRTPRLEIAG